MAKPEAEEEMAWVSAQVPQELAEALVRLAKAHDRSKSAEVRQAIRAHVEAHEPTGAAA